MKKKLIIILFIVTILIFLVFNLTKEDYITKNYNVKNGSNFEKKSIDEILDIIDKESSIIFIGKKDDENSKKVALLLDSLSEENNIKIYYVTEKDKSLDKVLKKIDKKININNYYPLVIITKNGLVLNYYYQNNIDYKNLEKDLKKDINNLLESEICTSETSC